MVDHTLEYGPIVQRAIATYDGLMVLYAQDAPSSDYFAHCLNQARSHRNGLQERLASPKYLADVFETTFVLSIDHFLESHRGEYEADMPGPDPAKAIVAGRYLAELRSVMNDIIRVGRTLELGT